MPQSETPLADLLAKLHNESETELLTRARAQFAGSDDAFASLARQYAEMAPRLRGRFLKAHGLSSDDAASSQGTTMSLAVSEGMGQFLHKLVLSLRPARILELGSSKGVSTLYFADALRRLGSGTVIATELDALKCARIREHAAMTGLAASIDLREGDVFQTIEALDGSVDLVFIDTWASGYLDVFKRIERLLRPGTVVLADNMYTAEEAVQPFRQYVASDRRFSSTTLDFESGVEFTVAL